MGPRITSDRLLEIERRCDEMVRTCEPGDYAADVVNLATFTKEISSELLALREEISDLRRRAK